MLLQVSPTFGGVKALNKLKRQLKSQPVKLQFWPLTGTLRIIGFPDATHRNNEDGSSQRGMTVFLAELRERSSKDGTVVRKSYWLWESERSKRLCSLQPWQNCIFSRNALVHASFSVYYWWTYQVKLHKFAWEMTHKNAGDDQQEQFTWPEQKETVHMISMLRKEASDQGVFTILPTFHLRTVWQIVWRKSSAKADNLITAVKTGRLLDVAHSSQF